MFTKGHRKEVPDDNLINCTFQPEINEKSKMLARNLEPSTERLNKTKVLRPCKSARDFNTSRSCTKERSDMCSGAVKEDMIDSGAEST